MTDTEEISSVAITMVEEYLAARICAEKLVPFQTAFDLLNRNEKFESLDMLDNIILNKSDVEEPAIMIDLITDALIELLTKAIGDFDITIRSDNIMMLSKIYESMTILDASEELNYIVNICDDEYTDDIGKLHNLIGIFNRIDEEEFRESVVIMSSNLINHIREYTSARLEAEQEAKEEEVPLDRKRILHIRKLREVYPHLNVFDRIVSGEIRPGMHKDVMVAYLADKLTDDASTDLKRTCQDIITHFLLTPIVEENLLQNIKENLVNLFSDDAFIMQLNSVLQSTYVEVMSHGQD